MTTDDTFLCRVRFALRHLYDASALQSSPLIEALGLSGSANAASGLRRTLIGTIRSLEPERDTPAHSQAWRVYEILLYRYVQQCSQLEAASQLGMSTRHLRREERKALAVLAPLLKGQLDISAGGDEGPGTQEITREDEEARSAINGELAWLEHASPEEQVELGKALRVSLELANPMAVRYGVRLEVVDFQETHALAVHPVALRQVVLSLLSVAIRHASGERVSISVRELDAYVEIQIRAVRSQPGYEETAEDAGSLAMAKRLTDTCRGRLTLSSDAQAHVTTVTFPTVREVLVLLIDDNADTVRLLQRYASGTCYRVYGVRNLEGALSLARQISPQIVVLDVMMPDIDGWELLGRLRQHPLTSHTPIIVCTILAEEELAYSLGASEFVRKPVSRQAFLSALARQARLVEPEPH